MPQVMPAQHLAGRFVLASYTNRSGTRAYKTYIPARDEGQPRPLVVMLHGCKQNPDDFAAGTRMNELADELGFIVAYPEQASAANVSRCWKVIAQATRTGGDLVARRLRRSR